MRTTRGSSAQSDETLKLCADRQGSYAVFLASYGDLYEDHQQSWQSEHLQPCQERWDVRRSDRTILRKIPAVVERDGKEPAKLWGVRNETSILDPEI